MYKILFFLFLIPVSSFAQNGQADEKTQTKIHNLPEFTVSSKRLSILNIIDSVIQYEDINYYYPQAFLACVSATYKEGSDTLFRAMTDSVFYCKSVKSRNLYSPKFANGQSSMVTSKPGEDYSLKVFDYDGYPKTSFKFILQLVRKEIQNHRALFGVSSQAGMQLHHLLIAPKEADKSPSRHFVKMTIERDSWKILQYETFNFDKRDSMILQVDTIRSYIEAMNVIEKAAEKPTTKLLHSKIKFRSTAFQKLIPAELSVSNNLLEFDEGNEYGKISKVNSYYTYFVNFFDFSSKPCAKNLTSFGVLDWFLQIKYPTNPTNAK